MAGSDEDAPGRLEALPGVAEEARGVGLDRVLERAPVDLDRVGDTGRESPGEDHRAHDQVVGQGEIDAPAVGDLPDGGGVPGDVGVDLGRAALAERPNLEALVAVVDVDGEDRPDVRPVDGHPDGLADDPDAQGAGVPVPGRVDVRVILWGALLGQEVDLVPETGQGRGQAGVVEVRERDRVLRPPLVDDDREHDRCRHDEQRQEQKWRGEAHFPQRTPTWTIAGREPGRAWAIAGSGRADPATGALGRIPGMTLGQRYRLRTPSTGRELIMEADGERTYVDRETGEPLEVIGKLLPLAPSPSRLPWAVENLRFCTWCEQLAQKDLNDCPTCGRRMDPLGG